MVHNHVIRIPFLVHRMSSEKLNTKQQFQFPPLPPPRMQFMQPKMIQDATNFKVWFGSDCCIPSLPHSGQSIHAPHDRWGGKKISKLNIPLTVIVSVCCARTDCGVLLPCWKAVYFSSLPLLFYVSLSSFPPIIAIWHSPFHCQSVPCCVTVDLLHWCPAPWSPLVKVCDKTLHCTISSCLAWQLGDKRNKYACKTGHLLSKWNTYRNLCPICKSKLNAFWWCGAHKIGCCFLFLLFVFILECIPEPCFRTRSPCWLSEPL